MSKARSLKAAAAQAEEAAVPRSTAGNQTDSMARKVEIPVGEEVFVPVGEEVAKLGRRRRRRGVPVGEEDLLEAGGTMVPHTVQGPGRETMPSDELEPRGH